MGITSNKEVYQNRFILFLSLIHNDGITVWHKWWFLKFSHHLFIFTNIKLQHLKVSRVWSFLKQLDIKINITLSAFISTFDPFLEKTTVETKQGDHSESQPHLRKPPNGRLIDAKHREVDFFSRIVSFDDQGQWRRETLINTIIFSFSHSGDTQLHLMSGTTKLLGGEILHRSGRFVDLSKKEYRGKIIGLYFSAQW